MFENGEGWEVDENLLRNADNRRMTSQRSRCMSSLQVVLCPRRIERYSDSSGTPTGGSSGVGPSSGGGESVVSGCG